MFDEYPRALFRSYTVGELLEATKRWGVTLTRHGGTWIAAIGKDIRDFHREFVSGQSEGTPVDALALCICNAIEKKLITAEELNK